MKKVSIKPSFLKKDIGISSEKKIWMHPKGSFSVYDLQCQLPVFGSGETYDVSRTVIEKRPFVIALPYDPHLDKVVLIEQIRMVGVFTRQDSPCLFELCAGFIDQGELSKDAAKREVFEESGLLVEQLEFVCDYWVSPGWTTERSYFYCAKVDSNLASETSGLPSESESTKTHCMDATSFIELADSGQLENHGILMAAFWFSKHRERLRQMWQK